MRISGHFSRSCQFSNTGKGSCQPGRYQKQPCFPHGKPKSTQPKPGIDQHFKKARLRLIKAKEQLLPQQAALSLQVMAIASCLQSMPK